MTTLYRSLIAIALVVSVSACATPEVARGINDPYEQRNRAIHNFNKNVDRNVLRPVSTAYGTVVPQPIRGGISNFAGNLSTPGYVVNDLLQGNIHDATSNALRFAVNVVFGLGGLLDVATEMGIPERDTDFGETLHVWGVGEGNYLELPFAGPSTERDRFGRIVDIFINPLRYTIPTPESYARPVAGGLAGLDARYQFGGIIDEVLYESADSYAQSRLFYLEQRRFELGGRSGGAGFDSEGEEVDPYADPFSFDPLSQ